MKIVITVEEFDPGKGYLEYYLARELTKLGHKVYVFTFGWSKHVLRTKLDEGFEVVSVPPIVAINGIHVPNFSVIAYVIKFIKMEKPDIIHCQPLYSPLSLIFISYEHLSKYKIVGSLVTGEYLIKSTIANLGYALTKIVTERYVENKTASFFAINEGWKKVLLQMFNLPDRKITIIPLGADSALFKFDAKTRINMRNQLGLSAEDVVVVYSGKIIQSKKLDVLLKAIALIIRQNQKVKLLIVGKGELPYMEYLKELCANLRISENVIFHSSVCRTKLPNFYSASDIAVWPGSVSISIIEAVSSGLPVIIKRSLIAKFAIAYGNGFAFEPDNTTELGGYLEKLITNYKLRKDMSERSRLLVEQKLNWKTIGNQYLDTYRKIID